jgi:hypothetical protein
MGVPAMRHRLDAVEPLREETLIALELELFGHDTGGIRQHAVDGDDGIGFDAARTSHGVLFSVRGM